MKLEEVQSVSFASLDPEATFCVMPPQEIGKYTNILFVVDISGSNHTTDPGKVRRLGAMQDFFNKHMSNEYLRWGLVTFGGATAQHLVTTAAGKNFGASAEFQSALTQFQGVADSGGTPYLAALGKTQVALNESLANAINEETNYQVVFISDGAPSDNDDPGIYTLVETVAKALEGRIFLSTVYYNVGGNGAATTKERLQKMAELGQGRYQDASNGEAINIDDLIVGGSYKESYFIKDLFIYNLNATQCDDGLMKADSDGDGLCDEDEIRYNSEMKNLSYVADAYKNKKFSVTNRYSFDERLSDLFMYKHIFNRDGLPSCENMADNTKVDEDGDLLNRCEEMFLNSKTPEGPTQEWTDSMIASGFSASPTNFDSDGDGILDSLEFLFFKNKGNALSFNTINLRFNGRTYYDYFKNHQSLLKPDATLPYNIKVEWVRRDSKGQNCYRIDQENLPVYKTQAVDPAGAGGNPRMVHGKDENVIMVYYLMTTENDPDGKGVMRYSYQKRSYNSKAPISFNDTSFEEVTAK